MKIGVVGLGLIGGSIFKKLSTLDGYEVVGVSNSVKGIDGVSQDYSNLKGCNLVFVCTPMRVVLDILNKLEEYLEADCIVTDVCSLKGFVSKRQYKYNFIPSHPMAGTEFSGWDNSFPELFNRAKWAVTPINNNLEGMDVLENIIEVLGAEVIITAPDEHDKAVALISHLPMMVAQALCENIKDNKLAQVLAATGFKDTTRLALSNTQMAADMVDYNQENIILGFNGLVDSFNDLLASNYEQKAKDIKNFRHNLYN